MISIYASAVFTSVVVAGAATMAIMESRKPDIAVFETAAFSRAHHYAIEKGTTFRANNMSASVLIEEIDLGPFFPTEQAVSVLHAEIDASLPARTPYRLVQVSWYTPRTAEEGLRVKNGLLGDEWTRIGVYGGDDGIEVPDVGREIPEGSVVMITETISS